MNTSFEQVNITPLKGPDGHSACLIGRAGKDVFIAEVARLSSYELAYQVCSDLIECLEGARFIAGSASYPLGILAEVSVLSDVEWQLATVDLLQMYEIFVQRYAPGTIVQARVRVLDKSPVRQSVRLEQFRKLQRCVVLSRGTFRADPIAVQGDQWAVAAFWWDTISNTSEEKLRRTAPSFAGIYGVYATLLEAQCVSAFLRSECVGERAELWHSRLAKRHVTALVREDVWLLRCGALSLVASDIEGIGSTTYEDSYRELILETWGGREDIA